MQKNGYVELNINYHPLYLDKFPSITLALWNIFYTFVTLSAFSQNISAKSSVLVLNTYYTNNKPLLTDLNGRAMNCPAFTIADNVEVYYSCALTFQDHFYVYGGETYKRQIAKVINKSLTKVGALPFDFSEGGCTSTTDKIILCFHYFDKRTCYKTTNPISQFEETRKSIHEHQWIKFASSECKFL